MKFAPMMHWLFSWSAWLLPVLAQVECTDLGSGSSGLGL